MLAGTSGGSGNLLLNVSPMLDGRMEIRQTDRLKGIGGWLQKYGDAVYGTLGGPYKPNKTFTSTHTGNKINILLLQRPPGAFTLKSIPGRKVLSAYFMGRENVAFTQDDNGIHLTLPDALPDANCSVIVLELNKNADDILLVE